MPTELHEELLDRCTSVATIDTDGNAETRVGIMACDRQVGLLLIVEVGTGPDGRPSATMRAIDNAGDPFRLSILEVDGQLLVSC